MSDKPEYALGTMFRVPWSPNPHRLEAIVKQYCQLHGEFIGWRLHLRKRRNSETRPWGSISVAAPSPEIQPLEDKPMTTDTNPESVKPSMTSTTEPAKGIDPKTEYDAFCIWAENWFPQFEPTPTSTLFDAWMGSARSRLAATPAQADAGALVEARNTALEEAAKMADYEAEISEDNLKEDYDPAFNRPARQISRRIAHAIRSLSRPSTAIDVAGEG